MRPRDLLRVLVALSVLAPAFSSSGVEIAFADSGVCATPGKDGPGGTLAGVVNTYYPGSSSVLAGSTSIPVGAPSGAATPIADGDLLLVIQMQDAAIDSSNTGAYGDGVAGDPATGSNNLNNSGRYEYVVATGPVAAGSVPIRGAGVGGGLTYAYTNAAATAGQGQRRFQVIRVPQYSTATLGSTLTALRWNGLVGGVLAIDVAGQLTLGGTVSVDGQGFRGGGGRQLGGAPGANTDYRTLATATTNGSKGEGIAGTPMFIFDAGTNTVVNTGVEGYPNGSMARGAPGNAGGGGTDGNPPANDENSGGGGGGNGGTGGQGGNTWSSNLSRGGFGGAAFPVAPDRLVLGGGGGAGTRNNTPGNPVASSGGAGGGIVLIRTGTVSGVGAITANGANGLTPDNDGGGGGGAGGTILLIAQSGGLGGLTASARGGNGGNAWPTQPPGGFPGERHGPGGGGGGGVILLSAAAASSNVSGGVRGTTTTALDPYGATSGLSGTARTNVTPAELSTGIAGAACLPVLTTSKTTSTPTLVNTPTGTTGVYTIHVTNAAGLGTALNLSIADSLPGGFTYASTNSVNLSGGAARPTTTDPAPGDTVPTWSAFTLPGGGAIDITFTVDIDTTVPDGTYQNPSTSTYADPVRSTSGGTTTSSYDPASSTAEDITVSSPPNVVAKSDVLIIDDGDGLAEPGETLEYTITITNNSWQAATGVVFTDSPDPNTALVVGSVVTSQGTVVSGNNPGDTAVTVDVGGLGARGGAVTITFRVTIDNPLPAGVTQVANQGTVSGTDFPSTITDDPDTSTPDDPTVTQVTAAPDLSITKDDGVTTVSPGSLLTYTLTISNVGNQNATGVTITDPLPANTAFVSATDSGVFSAGVVTWPTIPLAGGASVTRGVTVQVDDPLPAGVTSIVNTAQVQDDGTNGADPNPGDNSAQDVDLVSSTSKTLAATNQTFTSSPLVAIGEILSYQVDLAVPVGTMSALTLTDVLDEGLAFVGCDSILPSSTDVTTTIPGGFAGICSNPTVSAEPTGSIAPVDQGRRLAFDFGDVNNSGDPNGAITVRYRVVVLDSDSNLRGKNLGNLATWQWTGGTLQGGAEAVVIVEPALTLTKAVSPASALPGATLTFTLTVDHDPASDSDAFDLLLTDTVPSALAYVPGSLSLVSGQPPTALDESAAPTLRATWDTFANGGLNSVIQFQARLVSVPAGTTITNSADLEWSSLPGTVTSPQSAYNSLSTERYYDPGSSVDTYGVTSSVSINVVSLPSTGFAPGRITVLPPDPGAYSLVGDLRLEVPRLGLLMPIVGVPLAESGWDVTWLGWQAGYLEGTAFPTWPGNSALTGHVYLADGTPGPFFGLGSMHWGDQIIVHAYGQRSVYEVRQVSLVAPNDVSVLGHESLSWLTLITCSGFDEARDAYRSRTVVRAVLVEVEDEGTQRP